DLRSSKGYSNIWACNIFNANMLFNKRIRDIRAEPRAVRINSAWKIDGHHDRIFRYGKLTIQKSSNDVFRFSSHRTRKSGSKKGIDTHIYFRHSEYFGDTIDIFQF